MADSKVINLQHVKSAKRRIANWVDGWVDYTSVLPSPELWRKWSGIALLAGALEQKVWINTWIGQLFANQYIILVGPPGVGKTVLTSRVTTMWHELRDEHSSNSFHVAPSSVTSASLGDELREATRRILLLDRGVDVEFHSLAICSNELGVLLPEYDKAMMGKLTDIYDGHPYSERRRTKELNFRVESPQINLLAACTPSYLNDMLPDGAWDQGFLSRTMLVYSAERMIRPIFGPIVEQTDLFKDLSHDLLQIFSLYGPMKFTSEAAAAIEKWNSVGAPPVPDHPKLINYLTRRIAHVLKLCMVACAATASDLIITEEHFNIARDWLVELEFLLPDIFKAMIVNADYKAMQETWYEVAMAYGKDRKPISELFVVEKLSKLLPTYNVGRVLEVMIQTGILLRSKSPDGKGGSWFLPKATKPGT